MAFFDIFSYFLQQHDPQAPMGAYRLKEGLHSPFPFNRLSSYSLAQRQTLPVTLLQVTHTISLVFV